MNQALDHIKKGKLEELRKCITNVKNINKSNRNGENLLHLAVIYCKDNIGEKNRTITTKQIFELLIEKGVSVQQKNNQDVTPLTNYPINLNNIKPLNNSLICGFIIFS